MFNKKILVCVVISLLISYPQFSLENQHNSHKDNNVKIDSLEQKLKKQYERIERTRKGTRGCRHSLRYQAKCLAQGTTEEGFFDNKFIDKIVFVLKKIRVEFPEVRNICVRGGVYNTLNPVIINSPNNQLTYHYQTGNFPINNLYIYLSAEATKRVMKMLNIDLESVNTSSRVKLDSTDTEEIDNLNRKYGAVELKTYVYKSMKTGTIFIKFDNSLDILRLIEIYNKLPNVMGSGVQNMLESEHYNEVYLIIKNNNWHFVFQNVKHDRFSGSPILHYYYFAFLPESQKVIKIHEYKVDPSNPKIWLWGIPKYRPVSAFKSYNHLMKTVKSDKWWESLYALDVIGCILNTKSFKYAVDDNEKINIIRKKVTKNKIKMTEIILKNLINTDENISNTTYTHLRILSGKDYPKNDYEKWKGWFNKFKNNN